MKIFTKPVEWSARAIGGTFGLMGSAVKGTYGGIASGWKATPPSVKKGMGIVAGVSALAGLGAYLMMTPRGREYRESDREVAQVPPILTPQDLLAMTNSPQMMMESGPAEGRDPYHFRNAVNASKGRALEGINATQPNLDPALAAAQLG